MSVSPTSVTVARSLLVCIVISMLLLLQIVQDLVEELEPVVPGLLVRADPLVHRLERLPVEAVEAPAAVLADRDQRRLVGQSQVVGQLRVCKPGGRDELAPRLHAVRGGGGESATPRVSG